MGASDREVGLTIHHHSLQYLSLHSIIFHNQQEYLFILTISINYSKFNSLLVLEWT